MTIHEIISSEDYIDLIVEYTSEIASLLAQNDSIYCYHGYGEFRLLHIHRDMMPRFLELARDRIKYDYPSPMKRDSVNPALSISIISRICECGEPV